MKLFILTFLIPLILGCGCTSFLGAKQTSATDNFVLIIDAGHGGEDGGAVASDGTKESELNLSVALKTDAICNLLGYKTIMTRRSEELDYPDSAGTIRAKKIADQKMRVDLINGTPNAVLLSIHQNIYPSPTPCGSQALYGKFNGSELFAELIYLNAAQYIDPKNTRNSTGISDDIYLMKKAECPAVLIECGFLSNQEELKKLKSQEYQTKLAAVFAASYIQFTKQNNEI